MKSNVRWPAAAKLRGGGLRWLLLICILCGGAVVLAQTFGRTLTGTVTDRQHEPLVGAVVQVHNDVTGTVVSYITTSTGRFDFKRLDGNADYSVWATYRTHKSKVKQMSRFDSKPDKVIELVIELE